ncbi:hypothetical protein SAXI111661_12945 [Saccharomonospora xinjiangensis]|uniref:hypothetical protein n=1 Tax=Saccharomonospora xinjiangensis TaxID=75294 RepID=UPI00106F6988|nr:hypothetical protein [Saccharomonospora xinjiangensis]QBQ61452.1 hypothetical protein EYD13_15520 [Saccharomonospora xinjiangensis]
MGRYVPDALTTQTIEVLLSDLARATAVGEMSWSVKKPRTHEGQIEVRTALEDCPVGRLRIYWVDPRPDRIHVAYLVNHVPVRRLDVNDSHKDWVNTTHKHRYLPTGAEDAYIPDDIPHVALVPTVPPGTYQAVFEAFAAECRVTLPEGYWTEPGR